MKTFLIPLITLSALLLLATVGCRPEDRYLESDNISLQFSVDTLQTDTLFVSLDSKVYPLKVYNPYNRKVRISSVSLAKGSVSCFRLNVDGDTLLPARDLELAAGDSLFVFVSVKLRSTSAATLIEEDDILFDYGASIQRLHLEAPGRNAVFHLPTHTLTSDGEQYRYSIINCSAWDHTLPHVIYGMALIARDSVLSLSASDQLYFAVGASLWVYDGASLQAVGTQENPVLFTSLRHDDLYDNLAGQWDYIWLSAGSKDNVIDHAVIENATIGIVVDSNVTANPTLTIKNTIVRNHSQAGLLCQGSKVEALNLLAANCGVASMAMQYGGNYRLLYCTFANYWRGSLRSTPTLLASDHYTSATGDTVVRPLRLEMVNSIVWGNYTGHGNEGELRLMLANGSNNNILLNHCLLRTTTIDTADYPGMGLIVEKSPLFQDPQGGDYRLQSESPALGAAVTIPETPPTDLAGQVRPQPSAIGAYEMCDTTSVSLYSRGAPHTAPSAQAPCSTALSPAKVRHSEPKIHPPVRLKLRHTD